MEFVRVIQGILMVLMFLEDFASHDDLEDIPTVRIQ